jgi:hypothetical protein
MIANTLVAKFGSSNPELQLVLTEYRQARANPQGPDLRLRQGLLFFKTPQENLARLKAEAQDRLPNVRFLNLRYDQQVKKEFLKSDDRPKLFEESILPRSLRETLRFFFYLFLVMSLVILAIVRRKRQSLLHFSQFQVGVIFMFLVMAAAGAYSLYVGDPQVATPVLYLVTFLFGAVGGLLALKVKEKAFIYSFAAMSLYLVMLGIVFRHFKSDFLQIESIGTRACIMAAISIPPALLIEVPYIWILNQFTGRQRGFSYCLENMGSLLALPIGFIIQYEYGNSFLILVSIYILCLLFIAWYKAGGAVN